MYLSRRINIFILLFPFFLFYSITSNFSFITSFITFIGCMGNEKKITWSFCMLVKEC